MRLTNPGASDVTSACPSPAADLPGFLAWHRAQFGTARMEETDEEKAAREAAEAAAAAGKTYTQAEVDRLTAREKAQGERAGIRKALEQLGVDPDTVKPEDLKVTLDAARAAEDAQKTEAQREKDAAAAEKAASQREREAAATERHQLAIERALVAAGLPGEDVEDIALLVKADRGADAATIKTAVDDLKTKRPALFTTTTSTQLPHGDPGGQQRQQQSGGGSGKSLKERGRAKAEELGWATKAS